jgi:hypothetical protein
MAAATAKKDPVIARSALRLVYSICSGVSTKACLRSKACSAPVVHADMSTMIWSRRWRSAEVWIRLRLREIHPHLYIAREIDVQLGHNVEAYNTIKCEERRKLLQAEEP